MLRRNGLHKLSLGIALVLTLATVPAHVVHAAQPARPTSLPTIVPFSGTARITYTSSDSLVPAKATKDLSRSVQTEAFGVRDVAHWRVDMLVTAPIIDSHDETIVADEKQIVAYSTLFNRALRIPVGVTQSGTLLSVLLASREAPIGTTTARFVALVKSRPGEKVRSQGQAHLLGRTADVLQVSPLVRVYSGSCSNPSNCTTRQKGYGYATIWLDHEHGIVLRYEEHGMPKSIGAQHGYRYVVTSIQFGNGPSDSDLTYVPPVAVQDFPRDSSVVTSSSGSSTTFSAPPSFIKIASPTTQRAPMSLRGFGSGAEFLSSGPSFVEGVFRGSLTQGFVYVKERIRALGLPGQLTTGSARAAGSCQVWTGKFADGLRWLAMMRGQIAILLVADKLSQADLVQYAAKGICAAPIVPPPSARELQNIALDRLETEIDITRQILGWAVAAAPSSADKSSLKSFDARLQSFDRTVFAIRNRDNPQAVYRAPTFPPPQKRPFKTTVEALKGEVPAAKHALSEAAAAVLSPSDRQTLEQQGSVFDDLIQAVDAMLPA